MGALRPNAVPPAQRGALMIEVLVTIAILAIGLTGLMQMQSRLQKSEMESYQRTQALMLVNDMASRISTNRADAASYVIGDPTDPTSIGDVTIDCPTADPTSDTVQEVDRAEWCNALKGASERQGTSNVGALIGGRGCVYELADADGVEYMVSVVWQGLTPISAPSVICGKEPTNPYDRVGSECVNDLCRRAVTTIVRLVTLPP
jgi:type IV pilus assembly protein PilV